MDAAAVMRREPAAFDRLLEDCFALDDERCRPTALVRLEALIGTELAQRLLLVLSSSTADQPRSYAR